jgi:predicted metal-dependent peptidase
MTWNTEAVLEDVTRSTSNLILAEPFYGHFFVGILKEVHEGIQTMAIGPSGHNVKLHINPLFWLGQLKTDEMKMGLVKHEILHVLFKHIFRGKDYSQKDLFNIACDLVVNQYIDPNWLPENRIHLGLFPHIAMDPDRDADYYYRKLSELQDKFGGGEEGEDSTQIVGLGKEAWENLKKILGEGGGEEWQEKHGLWEELDQLPAALREILEDQINDAITQSLEKIRRDTKEWGKLPAGLRQHLNAFEASRNPVVDWRRLLRIFTESSSRTFVRNTVKRPSKRFGTTPGIRIRKRQKILVAVDTSSSISEEELQEFFAEMYHIWKRGAEITVVECDMKIVATYRYQGQAPGEVHGRGGTNFDAPIQFANETYHPDAIVYFTDGVAPPTQIRPRMPILWILSSKGAAPGNDYYERLKGMKVKMG